jgi:hypothetical protein
MALRLCSIAGTPGPLGWVVAMAVVTSALNPRLMLRASDADAVA